MCRGERLERKQPLSLEAMQEAAFDFFDTAENLEAEVILANKDRDQGRIIDSVAEQFTGSLKDRLRQYLAEPKKSLSKKQALGIFMGIGWETGYINFALRSRDFNTNIWVTLPGHTPGIAGRYKGINDIIPIIRESFVAFNLARKYGGLNGLIRTRRYAMKVVQSIYNKYLNKAEKPCAHIVICSPNLENLDDFKKQIDKLSEFADQQNWRLLIEYVNDPQKPEIMKVQELLEGSGFVPQGFYDLSKLDQRFNDAKKYWGFMIREPKQ